MKYSNCNHPQCACIYKSSTYTISYKVCGSTSNTHYNCVTSEVTSCMEKNKMKRIWFSVLVTSHCMELSQLHSSLQFEQLLGTRTESVLFSSDDLLYSYTFLVQGNVVTLLLSVLLAYFNVSGNENDE